MQRIQHNLPDRDLAYFAEGSVLFDDYVEAVEWAQNYAMLNRRHMLTLILDALKRELGWRAGREDADVEHRSRGDLLPPQLRRAGNAFRRARVRHAQGCDQREGRRARHHSRAAWAPSRTSFAGSAIRESFCSCSHGAGRRMSRAAARTEIQRARSRDPDAGRRVPQGQRRARRDSRRVQGHRRGDGESARPGRSRPHAEAGGVRQGLGRSAGPGSVRQPSGRSIRH